MLISLLMKARVRSYSAVVGRLTKASRLSTRFSLTEIGAATTSPSLYKLYMLTCPGREGARTVCLSAGIHGDEPAGVETLLRFIERGADGGDLSPVHLTIFPCINPYGYEYNTRQNANNMDLNRQYRKKKPPSEVEAVKRAIGRRTFDISLEFHEDSDAEGFYLYELTASHSLAVGEMIVEGIGQHWPVDRRPKIEGREAHDGIIRPGFLPADIPRVRPSRWPQALYLFHHGTRHCLTFETPSSLFPEDTRVRMHLTALRLTLDQLT